MPSGICRQSPAFVTLSATLLLALAAPAVTHAQGLLDGVPSITQGSGVMNVGTAPVRVWAATKRYGEETQETALGTHLATETGFGLAFIDGQLRTGSSDSDVSANAGLGVRWLGESAVWGASLWYDGEDTQLNNWYNQIGVSFERLSPLVDLRLNANFPLENTKVAGTSLVGTDALYTGNQLAVQTLTSADVSLRVVDFEVAPRILDLNLWVYGGGYQMDGDGISELGSKAGVRGYVYNDLALDLGITDDDEFGTYTALQVIWTPGRTAPGISDWSHQLADRLREHVYRNAYVATQQTTVSGTSALTDVNGDEFRIVHVDSSAAAGGDGTYENPLNSVANIQANSQQGDIVLVHAGSTFVGQSATLQDEQRLLGEGGNQTHDVVTTELETIVLPESSAGALAGAIPVIQNAGGDAIILAGGNVEVSTLDAIEVSNLSIDGGTRGIASTSGVGAVNINRMTIANTTGHGIDLTPLEETLANSSTQARLSATIDEITFSGVGGDDIHVNGTTVETTNAGTIAISNITSTDGNGVGVALVDANRATTIADIAWDGGTTGVGALLIQDATAEATVAVSGTNTVTGGTSATPDTAGYAVRIDNSAGSHTIAGMTVTDTGGDSVQVNGGSADLNFGGQLNQANNASVVSVSGGHTGSLTFSEAATDAGVINATNGDGLQFDDADGVYTFNDAVVLNGGDAGIDILNDSAASITLADATITDPTGAAVNVVGGSASMDFTGKITQANNAAAVSVSSGHTGTLNFNEGTTGDGVLVATNGTGLVFNNADGGYLFNDKVTLAGGDASVDVVNDSEGTFTFAEADITNPTGTAVLVQASNAVVNFNSGVITTNSGASHAIDILDNTGGSISFASASTLNATAGMGVRMQGNASTTVAFNGDATLNTGTNTAVEVDNNTSSGVTFANADATYSGVGNAIAVTDNTSTTVAFSDGDISATSGRPLAITGNTAGSVTFAAATTITGTGDGILVQNNDGTTTAVNGKVTLTGANANITVDGNLAGTSVTFADADVTYSGAGNAVGVTDNTGTTVAFNNGDISASVGRPVAVTGNTDGSVTFAAATSVTGTAEGISVQNNNGTATAFNGAVTLTTGVNDAIVIDNTGGSTRFATLDVKTTGGRGLVANANTDHAVTVTGAATFDTATGNAVEDTGNSGGSLAFNSTVDVTTTSGDAFTTSGNTDGHTASVSGITTINTSGGDGVTITGNSGGSTAFTRLDVKTTGNGNGVTATGNTNHALQVTGTSSTIATETGTGLNLNGVSVNPAGVNFASVNVAGDGATGPVNGIVLQNLTGSGAVVIGANGTIAGDGGSIAGTTGDAVVITDAANVSLNHMNINSTAGIALDYNVTKSAASRLTLNGNTIDSSSGITVDMDVDTTASIANITIENNSITNTNANAALTLNTAGVTAKTVNLLVQNNLTVRSDSPAATANIIVGQSTTLNANVLNNQFGNTDATPGKPFNMETTMASSTARLNLNGNTGTADSGNGFFLTETAGQFTVEDLANVDTNNTGGVTTTGGITNDAGGIPTP